MKNYKAVAIYTGYAENGIDHVWGIVASDLEAAIKSVEDTQLNEMMEDEDFNQDFYDEFFGNGEVADDGVGVVGAGEEDIMVIFEEGTYWYSLVDKFPEWNDETFAAWNEFLNEGLY